MTAYAMIAGRLHGEPVTRPTRNGGQVTFFKLRVINGAEIEWWDAATFSDTARAELEGVNEGDAVSAVGVLRVEMFEHRGEQRIKRSLTADRVLALKPTKEPKAKVDKPSRAAPPKSESRAESLPSDRGGRGFDDSIPF
jgi:single-stranded DNA-binding protein